MRRVVVTGFGVVSPIGNGGSAFFRGLTESRSGIAEITGFDARSFPTRIAAEVVDPLSSIEDYKGAWEAALKRDRKSRFGLIAAREAYRSSFGGARVLPYDPRRIGASIAAGLELFDVRDLLRHLKHGACDGTDLLREALKLDCHQVGSVPADAGAQVIREEFALRGPFGVVLSACAAGTQAIGEAFLAIRDDVADAMFAGGYDSMINPLGLGGFCLLEAMSRRNDLGGLASRPFDASRDGFVLGEGAAMFVLEEYESALRRGATILAEIEGYGSSLDAYRVTDPEPDGRGAIAAMAQALAMANLSPRDIDYVNAHGTGTPKNDPVEARAIRTVLGSDVDRIYVSSTKSQIGHLIGAAGAVEFAACLYALREEQVPATITLEHPDPECRLRHVAKQPIQVPVRRVLSNSLGFGGQNASIVLGQPPISRLGEQ
ncbi:MAG TPA: beta-ketoacyl-[acyl-carrier-protein] synthase family protein [Polyangiaceae bacterium]|nr:beta-ketoacyl-[acyl-carrier-protein] synthase family protein [Polyangiaceae bacterium]